MDHFTEYIIKQKKSKFQILATIGMVILAVAVLVLTLPYTVYPIAQTVIVLIDAALIYGIYLVATSFNIEYEYCVVNSEMDVDKITNRKTRRRITTVKFKNIELMAPVGDSRFTDSENGEFAKVIMAAISPDHPDAYFVIYEKDGKRTKLIFNPTHKMIEIATVFAPRKVYER